MKETLKELAEEITLFLKYFEKKYPEKYCDPCAYPTGNRIMIKTKLFTESTITKKEAISYLSWLKAGNEGSDGDYKRKMRELAERINVSK